MIVVAGTITIDPANNGRLEELLHELIPATRAEVGNVDYGFWRSLGEPGGWHIFEEWKDEDALNEHMGSAHMAAFIGAMGDLGVTQVDLQRYEISGKSKLM